MKTVTNPKGIPITLAYPPAWFASEWGHRGLSGGVVIVNDRRETPSALARSDANGPFGTHIRDFVGVTVLKAPNHTAGPTDSSFPLDMADAKVDPGWGQESVRYLNAQVGGMPIRIMVFAAKDALPEDIAAADGIVASIRPTNRAADIQRATVPDVIGKQSLIAVRELHDAGLIVLGVYQECFSDQPDGTVLRTSIPVGSHVALGSNISIDVSIQGSPPSGAPRCQGASGAETGWTTSMTSIGSPAVVHDDRGRTWILVEQDLAPNGAFVALGPVPECPNGSAGKVLVEGVHQGISLRCDQFGAGWFGDGSPEGSNPTGYSHPLAVTPLFATQDGRLIFAGG